MSMPETYLGLFEDALETLSAAQTALRKASALPVDIPTALELEIAQNLATLDHTVEAFESILGSLDAHLDQ